MNSSNVPGLALANRTSNANRLYIHSQMYYDLDRFLESIIFLTLTIEQDPNHLAAYVDLIYAYFKLGLIVQGKEAIEKAKLIVPESKKDSLNLNPDTVKPNPNKFFVNYVFVINTIHFLRKHHAFFLAPFLDIESFQAWALGYKDEKDDIKKKIADLYDAIEQEHIAYESHQGYKRFLDNAVSKIDKCQKSSESIDELLTYLDLLINVLSNSLRKWKLHDKLHVFIDNLIKSINQLRNNFDSLRDLSAGLKLYLDTHDQLQAFKNALIDIADRDDIGALTRFLKHTCNHSLMQHLNKHTNNPMLAKWQADYNNLARNTM